MDFPAWARPPMRFTLLICLAHGTFFCRPARYDYTFPSILKGILYERSRRLWIKILIDEEEEYKEVKRRDRNNRNKLFNSRISLLYR